MMTDFLWFLIFMAAWFALDLWREHGRRAARACPKSKRGVECFPSAVDDKCPMCGGEVKPL